MIIGYVRVSTGGQTVENQKLAIYEAGYKPDKWYEVNASSRKSLRKRRVNELLDMLNKDDLVVVAELSRLSRSIGQTILLIDELQKIGARLHCIKENIKLDGGKMDIQGKVMTTMFALFADIERDLISERTKEGIERARSEGKNIGRPKGPGKSKLDERRAEIIEYLKLGLNVSAIAKLVGANWNTVGNFIKSRNLRNEADTKTKITKKRKLETVKKPTLERSNEFWEKLTAGYRGHNTPDRMRTMFEHLMKLRPTNAIEIRKEMCKSLSVEQVPVKFLKKGLKRMVEMDLVTWDGDVNEKITWI